MAVPLAVEEGSGSPRARGRPRSARRTEGIAMYDRTLPPIAAKVSQAPIGYRRNGRAIFPIAGGSPHAGVAVDSGPTAAEAGHHDGGGRRVPFPRASYWYREKMRVDTVQLSTSQQPQSAIPVTPGGFLRGIWLEVSGTGGVLNTAVLGSPSDWPFNMISSITLEDVNGQA